MWWKKLERAWIDAADMGRHFYHFTTIIIWERLEFESARSGNESEKWRWILFLYCKLRLFEVGVGWGLSVSVGFHLGIKLSNVVYL